MASDLDLVGRLRAYELGRAIRVSSHLQVAIQPDALVLSPISMAGEDCSIHVIAFGRIGDPPRFKFVPDPRIRDAQNQLFADLGEILWGYFQACRVAGTCPQLWVSSTAAVSLLDTLGDSLRYTRSNPMAKRWGECLAYASERYPVAGQQALLTAAGTLRKHFVTGQPSEDDEHLGTILTWIDPPPSEPVISAAARAVETPMGVKTDPKFDCDVLGPLIRKYHESVQKGFGRVPLASIEGDIRDALQPVAVNIYEATQKAIQILLSLKLPPLPDIPSMETREISAFNAFMEDRDAGFYLPLHDKPKSAAFKIAEREDAANNVAAALVAGDGFERVRAEIAGQVLVGKVAIAQKVAVAGWSHEYKIELHSRQKILRVRRGDRLFWLDDPRLCLSVLGVHRIGRTTQVLLRIQAGMRSIGLPSTGSILELAPDLPDWHRHGRILGKLSRRLVDIPWTHKLGGIPSPTPKTGQPLDPLANVEALS